MQINVPVSEPKHSSFIEIDFAFTFNITLPVVRTTHTHTKRFPTANKKEG